MSLGSSPEVLILLSQGSHFDNQEQEDSKKQNKEVEEGEESEIQRLVLKGP